MKRFLLLALSVSFALGLSLLVEAQSYTLTQISAQKLYDTARLPLNGTIVVTLTDSTGTPVTYTPQGGSPSTAPFTATVKNGAVQLVAGFQPFTVPAAATTSPAGIVYQIQTKDQSGTVVWTFPKTPIDQQYYSLDSYIAQAAQPISGSGAPTVPHCAGGAQYTDTSAPTVPWACTILTQPDKTTVWTQNPSQSPQCPGMAIAYPLIGNPYCLSPAQAFLLPGYVLGNNGAAPAMAQPIVQSGGGGSTPAPPAFAIQFANTTASALQADPYITVNPTGHILGVGTGDVAGQIQVDGGCTGTCATLASADGVTWNMGQNLALSGNINASAATFSGALTGTTANLAGALTGTTANLAGTLTGTTANFSADLTASTLSASTSVVSPTLPKSPEQYGAKHDAVEVTDANWTLGSTTITTTTSAPFTSTAVDAGKILVIQGAGQVGAVSQSSKNQFGAVRQTALWSTIVSITNSHTAVIANTPADLTGTVMSVVYNSGLSPTGGVASTCTLTLPNGGTGTLYLTSINAIAPGTSVTITALDTGEASPPTTAVSTNGSATNCSGTANITTTLGPGSGSGAYMAFGSNDHAAVNSCVQNGTNLGGECRLAAGTKYMLGTTAGVSTISISGSGGLLDGTASVICAPSATHTAGSNDRCFSVTGTVTACASGAYSTCPGTQVPIPKGATSIPLANASDCALAATSPWVILLEMYGGGQGSYTDWAQPKSCSGSNLILKTGTRMAFPCSESVVIGVTGCGIYIVPNPVKNVTIADLTIIGPNLQDPTGTNRQVSPIYTLFAQNITLRNLKGYCMSAECIYGQLNNGMHLDGINILAESTNMEIAEVVNLTITNSHFQKGSYAISGYLGSCDSGASNLGMLLDEGTGFYSITNTSIEDACNTGLAAQYGVHDGYISGVTVGFLPVAFPTFQCTGIDFVGGYNNVVSGSSTAGCGGTVASAGVRFTNSSQVNITSSGNSAFGNNVSNFITPLSIGALDIATSNISGIQTSSHTTSAPQGQFGLSGVPGQSTPAIIIPGSSTNGIAATQYGDTTLAPISSCGTLSSSGGWYCAFNATPTGSGNWISALATNATSIVMQNATGFYYYATDAGTCPATGTNSFTTCFGATPIFTCLSHGSGCTVRNNLTVSAGTLTVAQAFALSAHLNACGLNTNSGGVVGTTTCTGTGNTVLSDSAALTGNPTAPTPAATDSSTTIGTTSFGHSLNLVATLTTTAATTDNVTVTGMTSTGHCSLTPTNASAATNIATTYISAKTTNQITVTHIATSGMTMDVRCTPY